MTNENISKEEQIGIHKGALSVLAIEQQEFMKLLQVIQQQIQGHVKALKELGVDLEEQAKQAQASPDNIQTARTKDSKDDLGKRLG
jgi:tagatose-1,6-bisphosphate aldolase